MEGGPPLHWHTTGGSRSAFWCASSEIRTRVLTLKGLCPGPLDDGGGLGRYFTIQQADGQASILIRLALLHQALAYQNELFGQLAINCLRHP
jgi:hypothetical protein